MTHQFHFLQHFLEQRVTRREKESSKKVSSLTFVAEMLLNKKKKKKKEETRKNFQIIPALLQARLEVRFVASSFTKVVHDPE